MHFKSALRTEMKRDRKRLNFEIQSESQYYIVRVKTVALKFLDSFNSA